MDISSDLNRVWLPRIKACDSTVLVISPVCEVDDLHISETQMSVPTTTPEPSCTTWSQLLSLYGESNTVAKTDDPSCRWNRVTPTTSTKLPWHITFRQESTIPYIRAQHAPSKFGCFCVFAISRLSISACRLARSLSWHLFRNPPSGWFHYAGRHSGAQLNAFASGNLLAMAQDGHCECSLSHFERHL